MKELIIGLSRKKKENLFFFTEISKLKDQDIRDFFYCGFSNILKNCSIWLQKSNKLTRDLNKKPSDPIPTFYKQIKMMMRGNARFYELSKEKNHLEIPSQVYCTDARTIPVKDNSVSLIVTSPPYVTSYEYADLHQLTALWIDTHGQARGTLTEYKLRLTGSAGKPPLRSGTHSPTGKHRGTLRLIRIYKGFKRFSQTIYRHFLS